MIFNVSKAILNGAVDYIDDRTTAKKFGVWLDKFIKGGEAKLVELNQNGVYLVYARSKTAFWFMADKDGEISKIAEVCVAPLDYDVCDNLLIILSDGFSYYSNVRVYRIAETGLKLLTFMSGE